MKNSVCVVLFLLVTLSSRAKIFIDLYGGRGRVHDGSFTAYENREVEIPGGDLTSQGELDGEVSPLRGIRGGYWLSGKFRNFGAAADISYFNTESRTSEADVSFLSLGGMLMARYPMMESEKYPAGRFYPYAGLGVMRSMVNIDSPYNADAQGDVNSNPGLVFCTGVKWMLTPRYGLFAEYREVSVSFDERDVNVKRDLFGSPHTRVFEAEGNVQVYHLLVGFSVHF